MKSVGHEGLREASSGTERNILINLADDADDKFFILNIVGMT